MSTRVAVVGIGHTAFRATSPGLSYKELMFEAATRAYADAGLDPRQDVDSFLTCSEDYNEGTMIFDEYVPDQIGGAQRPVYTVGGDAIHGLATAYMQILSGVVGVVAVEAHSKASNVVTAERVHAMALDPIHARPLEVHPEFVAGLEADAYLRASGATREHCAHVVAKNRRNALANPAAAHGAAVDPEDVLAAPPAFEPLSQLDVSPFADGAAVIVLASEERAKAFSGRPVWVRGIGWANGSFSLAERDWAEAAYARTAAEMAYRLAGIGDPRREIDFAEVDDTYSYKELQHLEALRLFEPGRAGPATAQGQTRRDGEFPVNPSGGSLGVGRLLEASGAQKVIEVVNQLRGDAGHRQLANVRVGLAQSWRGVPTASGGVVVLSDE
ncbi:MAG TPA: acetyl-CoA acetyltransferase [Dehalococcoidia bacterium]|nr:acetyl-CoA acetyltransferase [Dehalococcoidia bacterium]